MSHFALGLASFPLLLLLLLLRIRIGVAMLLVGGAGYLLIRGWAPLLAYLKTGPYLQLSSYTLSVIPMFLLMGQFATQAGMSRSLFQAANDWLGHRRGGVAMAAVGACAGFGSICGSSLATAATMGRVALPEMRRLGYSGALATASLAAGGTLGILIPPSVVLVIYAILTEQNIARMFAAAFIPGLLAAAGYLLAIAAYVRRRPLAGPAAPRAGWRQRRHSLLQTLPALAVFLLVVGGIYLGWFTPTEAAAVGAGTLGVLAFSHGGMRLRGLMRCLLGTAETTGMIFLILLGAELYNAFLALTRMPQELAQLLAANALPPLLILLCILLLYLLLGCVMDSLSMILLTIPIFFPLVMGLDFGLGQEEAAIWFGILVLVVVEVGLITPPVGMNVFVINSLADGVPMRDTFAGIVPFLVSDLARIALLIAFPGISLGLVRLFA